MDPLINLLRQNARTPIEQIGLELNLSPGEVMAKIAYLESTGAILGYQAILDPVRSGSQNVTAIIEVKITPERGGGFSRLAARIAQFEQVQSCYLMSGAYDLLVIVEGNTLQEVANFVAEKLATIKGVISTATHFRLKAYKENGTLLLPKEPSERLNVAP